MLVSHRINHIQTHTHMQSKHIPYPPCAPLQPISSKLVAVNEAADACVLCSLQLPSGHLTRPVRPHTGTTCAVACQGERRGNMWPGRNENTGTHWYQVFHILVRLCGPLLVFIQLVLVLWWETQRCVRVRFTRCVSDFMGHWQEPVVWCLHNRKGAHWWSEMSLLVLRREGTWTSHNEWVIFCTFLLQVEVCRWVLNLRGVIEVFV